MNKYIIIFLIILKLLFTLFCRVNNDKHLTANISFSNTDRNFEGDEYDIATIANCYNKGLGFCRYVKTPDTSYYEKTSYRSFQVVFIHVFYQRFYNKFIAPLKDTDIYRDKKISKYYFIYGQFIMWLAFVLTIISIPFFKKIIEAIIVNKNKYIINSLLFLYIIFPSALIYNGAIPMYENIAVPCLVIIISILIQFMQGNQKKYSAIFVAILTGFVISIRPQVIMPLLFVYSFVAFYFIKKLYFTKKIDKGILSILIYTTIIVSISIGQTLYINYKLWNKFSLSTRGDALLWGHNPLAKGSWDAAIDIPGSKGYNYQKENIPGLLKMNEYQSSKAKSALAIKNISAYPKHEAWLFIKKIGIFFLPYNYSNSHLNLISFFAYFGFVRYCFYFILFLKSEIINYSRIICFLFILGVIAENIIFFVEYRVRYFADPFMLLLSAWIFIMLFEKKIMH